MAILENIDTLNLFKTNVQKQRHPIVYTVPIKILKTLESPHEKWCVAGESFCEF